MTWFLSQDCENDYTEEPEYGYKRKLVDEVEIIAIAECYLCGSIMTETEEVITFNGQTFCGEPHVIEYERMIEDGEI